MQVGVRVTKFPEVLVERESRVRADHLELREALADRTEIAAAAETEMNQDRQLELFETSEERRQQLSPVIMPVRMQLDAHHATRAPETLQILEDLWIVARVQKYPAQEFVRAGLDQLSDGLVVRAAIDAKHLPVQP